MTLIFQLGKLSAVFVVVAVQTHIPHVLTAQVCTEQLFSSFFFASLYPSL